MTAELKVRRLTAHLRNSKRLTIPAWELREALQSNTRFLSTYEKDDQPGPWTVEFPAASGE